ncbi:MAG: 2-dehydropantoate 2-reductase [Luminiphilus sp.]
MMNSTWHILGSGAIGGLFACRLKDAGASVVLCSRDANATEQSIVLRENDQSRSISFPSEPLAAATPISHLLLTTKSYDAVDAMKSVAHRLQKDAVVLAMMNGMTHVSSIPELVPESKVVFATTTAGCHRSGDEWIPAGNGKTLLGTLDKHPDAPTWLETWQAAMPNVSWETDIEQRLVEKVAINACINPLTAANNIRNGELLAPKYQPLLDKVIAEVESILMAMNQPDISANLRSRVYQVISDTADNRSSMATDVQNRRKTEINEIVGWLLNHEAIRRADIALPALRKLNESVKSIEPAH